MLLVAFLRNIDRQSASYWTGFHDSTPVTASADNHCSIYLFRIEVKTNRNEN